MLVTVIVFALGGLDEYHQSLVPGRNATFGDTLADTVGGLFGAIVGLTMATVGPKKAEPGKEQGPNRSPS